MNVKNNFKKIVLLVVFCSVAALLSAQTTMDEMEALLASDTITYAQTARFVLRASEKLVTSNQEEAFRYAADRDWLPKNVKPDETAQIGGISLLLMEAFDIEGGFMYTISKTSRYAYRELVYKDIIQSTVDAFTIVSGEELLFIVGRILNIREEEEELAAKRAEERLAREAEDKNKLTFESTDFGLSIDQYIALYNDNDLDERVFEYQAGAVPYVSFILGDIGNFFGSLGLTFGHKDEFYFVPELLRTEVSLRFGALGVRGGRIIYADGSGYIARGLFDGLQITHTSPLGRFGAGVMLSGAIYKKTAMIMMTEEDEELFDSVLDKDDYLNTYFAPRRLIAALDWEHPAVGSLLSLKASVLGQFDLSRDRPEKFNTQYISLKAGYTINDLFIEVGGTFSSVMFTNDEDSFFSFRLLEFALAGDLKVNWVLPTSFTSMLSFNLKYGSGMTDGRLTAFVPVTTIYLGEIFQPKLTGTTVVSLNYSARLFRTLGASITGSYFFRNGLIVPDAYQIKGVGAGSDDKDDIKRSLGAEVYAQLTWAPFSDVQYNLGVGRYLPYLGSYWPDEKSLWRVSLTSTLSF